VTSFAAFVALLGKSGARPEVFQRLDTPEARALYARLDASDGAALVAEVTADPADIAVAERAHEEARRALGAFLRHGDEPLARLRGSRADAKLRSKLVALAEEVEREAYQQRPALAASPRRAPPRASGGRPR